MSDAWDAFRQKPSAAPQPVSDPWSSFKQPSSLGLTEDVLKKRGQELLAQRQSDIDYQTGAPVPVRVGLQRASNPQEADLFLKKFYGPGKYGQDQSGQWWVEQNGKKTSVLPGGLSGGLKNIGTGMLSSGWPMAGAIGGGIVGEMIMPAGGGIPGAMGGAALGKGIDDLIKWTQGIFSQTPTETVSGMANEGAVAGVFQGAGPVLRQTGQALKGGLQKFVGVTPTTRAMAQDVSAGGARPPVGSFAPEATSIEYKRQLRNMLAGNPAEAKNIDYLTKRMEGVFVQEGIPKAARDKLIEEIYNTSSRTSTRAAGEAITARAKSIQTGLLTDYNNARAMAEQQIVNFDKLLRQSSTAPASTAKDVSEAIVDERRQFSKYMGGVYKAVDRMAGDREIVPTTLIKQQAKELADVVPETALPPLLKRWATEGAPDKITFEQAHALRTTLREMGEVVDVSPIGQRTGNIRKMAGAVDAAIRATTDIVGKRAADALKQADALYAKGIAKYNNGLINRIVKELRTGIVPEPGYVAKLIMNQDNPNLARTVFSMLPQNVRDNVVRADLGNMISAASYRGANGQLRMDGQSLLKVLDDRKAVIDATYPKQMVDSLRSYAKDLAAFDGKIDVTGIKTPTAITNLLERSVGAMRAADEFSRTNPLGALASGTPMQVDRALAHITRPGNEAITNTVAKTLGVDSAEWKAVRRYAVQRLFAGAIEEKQSLAKTISGAQIDSILNRYTAKQQELLFPHGMADDLRLLAREAKFLFPYQANEFGTSLAAANIKSGLWLNPIAVWKYVRINVMGYIADHPKLLRFLTSEIRQNPVQARRFMSVMGQWLTERSLLGGPGSGRSPQQEQSPQREQMNESQFRYAGPTDE